MDNNICQCIFCKERRGIKKIERKQYMIGITKQQEFEAVCFMYEHIDNELKVVVAKYNNNQPLNDRQRSAIAKAIWRL